MTQFSTSERKDVRAAEKHAKQMERLQGEVISQLMSTIGGRSWVLDILERCHIFANPFNTDATLMSFACGELNVGQQIFSDVMRHCPDQYMVMMQERNERNAARRAAAEQSRGENADGGDQISGPANGGDPEGGGEGARSEDG